MRIRRLKLRRSFTGWLLFSAGFLAALAVAAGIKAPRPSYPAPGAGLDFHVSPLGSDSADGSSNRPWATITHAGSVVGPGAAVHVEPGTYDETVVTHAAGLPNYRITYVSDKPGAALIAPKKRDYFAWKNFGDYSDVIGFEVASTDCNGIGLAGSFQRAVANNVHNSADNCNRFPGAGSGIETSETSTRDDDILFNFVHDVGIEDDQCGQPHHDLVQGIYQANWGGHIDHNISANNCGFGVHLWHAATHATITNNTVVVNRAGGVIVGSGDAPCSTTGCPGGNDYTIVQNNIVAYNGNPVAKSWGIMEASQDPGVIGVHNSYSHNLTFENAQTDFRLFKQSACLNCIQGQDPLFVSLSNRDFHLMPGSPAIGRGAPLQGVPFVDYVRIKSLGVMSQKDIGALGQ